MSGEQIELGRLYRIRVESPTTYGWGWCWRRPNQHARIVRITPEGSFQTFLTENCDCYMATSSHRLTYGHVLYREDIAGLELVEE